MHWPEYHRNNRGIHVQALHLHLSYHYSVHPNKPYVFFINSLFEIVAYNYITDSEVIIDTNTYNNTHLTLSQDGNKIAFIGLNEGETSSNNTLFIGKIKL